MESGTDSASSVSIPVTEYSETFQRKILAPLQSAYLYDESKLSFTYKSASLVKNATLKQKYAAFRAKRRQAGYSEQDLEETYGFLLFNDVTKANAFGQTGVLTGTSTCTSLGDPLKGVYISMFSDCLGPERWQDGQSGYIAIVRLTTGKVKRVSANQTQDLGTPTVGFDCHVSQHLASVTTQTSFSLAFERTQCFIYELLDNRSNETAVSPSLTCPFAVVAFSYKKRRALAMKEPKPCGFISYEILRFLPVLRLAEDEVKKTNADPNKGMCNIAANSMQTYTVLLNPGLAPKSISGTDYS
ncbi:protein TASOR-like [Phycodurus eques]|uniref:protein TASOR-like n=1 Tax=Phycodurus eques TaxID=693459 RepID=UPI002ACDEF9F|nr:protein TASOR-like [Phycodurus eques]